MKIIFLFNLVIVAINGWTSKKNEYENEIKNQDMYDEIADKVIESKYL